MKIGYSAQTGFVRVAIDENNSGNFHICLNEKVDLSLHGGRRPILVSVQLQDN